MLEFIPAAELTRISTLRLPLEAKVRLLATACRMNVLYMIQRAGSGHIGTSFSCMDVVCALYLEGRVLPPRGRYFSSKGHDAPALYSVLIALGLLDAELLHRLRRLGGLPGHPDVGTPYIVANTGSLGMGISKAKGMILADRLRGERVDTYVLTGDGELQEGQFWESLQPASNARLDELTVIVDHNKVQSDTLVARVSDLGDLPSKVAAFGWQVERADGHDPHMFLEALERLSSRRGPRLLLLDTVKGKGVSFMEHTAQRPPDDRLYPYHSGALDAAVYERARDELRDRVSQLLGEVGAAPLRTERGQAPARTAPARPQRLIAAYSRALVRCARVDERIVALDADLVKDTGLVAFEEQFPGRFVECGIAEQDMVSTAGGIALRGLVPVVHSFACFLSARPNEQMYTNSTERTKVVYVGSLAGLLPGTPGHSHQSVRDIATMGTLPGLIAFEPASERAVEQAVMRCLEGPESWYLRLASVPWELPFDPTVAPLIVGRGSVVREGDDCVIFAYGPVMLSQAFGAAELLDGRGIRARVVDLPWLNRIDSEWLRDTIRQRRGVFTLDDHYVIGGQGQLILAAMATAGVAPAVVRSFGVDRIPECGANDEVLRVHRLDAASIGERIAEALG